MNLLPICFSHPQHTTGAVTRASFVAVYSTFSSLANFPPAPLQVSFFLSLLVIFHIVQVYLTFSALGDPQVFIFSASGA